jgi:hypothetical protein
LRSFSTTPGAAAERPVVRFFFSVRQRPTLVGGWAVKNVLAMSGNGYRMVPVYPTSAL